MWESEESMAEIRMGAAYSHAACPQGKPLMMAK
jgi:hypothetical protein